LLSDSAGSVCALKKNVVSSTEDSAGVASTQRAQFAAWTAAAARFAPSLHHPMPGPAWSKIWLSSPMLCTA